MKFACDECAAQYMIADEKVGSKGVKVKCKKCSHVIVVRPQVETDPGEREAEREDSLTQMGTPPQEEGSAPAGLAATDEGVDATIVMPNPMGDSQSSPSESEDPAPAAPAPAEGMGAPVPMAATAPDLGGGTGLEEAGDGFGGKDADLEQALGAELGAALGEDIAPPANGSSAPQESAPTPETESSEPVGSESPQAAAPAAAAAAPPGPDDEIGMAFDSIFGAGAGPVTDPGGPPADPFSSDVDDAFEAALGSELESELGAVVEDEHASTRVFDTQSMQVLAGERELQADTEDEVETGNGAAPEDSGEAEWYVAVDEEQVGPLTAAEVQVRWEAGDIGPDSLCWKNGMGDWEPLSTVEGLKELIAPMPDAFVPEPMPAAAEPAAASPGLEDDIPGDEADGGWKPGAAALLATLAADEMDALENEPVETLAAPTADPVGLPAPAPDAPLGTPALGGIDLGSLPPPPAAPADEALPPAALGAPLTPGGAFQPEPATRPPPAYSTPAGGIPALGPATGQVPVVGPPHHTTGAVHTLPVGPATGAVSTLGAAPGGMQLTLGKLAALGGGLLTLLTLIIFGGLWSFGVFDKEAAVADPVGEAPVATAPPAAAPAAAAPAAAAPAPAAAAPAAAAPAPAAAAPVAVAAAPAAAAPKAEARPKARTRPRNRTTPKARTEPKRADPPKAATQPKKTGGGGLLDDDEFDDLFDDKPKRGGNTGGSGPSRGYVPPAPGAGKNLPKALGQSDILKVVAQNKRKLKGCADKQKAAAPGEKGRFVMNWRIRPDGSPASVSCKSKGAPVFCKCMKGAIGSMKFPRYGGPPMAAFDFPFSY